MRKRITAGIMAIVLAMICFFGVFDQNVWASNKVPGKPTELRIELLKEALGINTMNPSFSWVVNDSDNNEVQTAYRIIVAKRITMENPVHDTGWVNSNNNTFVHIEELSSLLEENEIYYWQVQTKDKDGAESPLSAPSLFMTNIGSEWESLDGIWATPSETAADLWTDTVIEQQITITAGNAFGLLYRMDPNTKTGYMIQLRDIDNLIKVHRINAGNVDTNAFSEIELKDYGITMPSSNTEFSFKIEAEGTVVNFYINGSAAGSIDVYSYGNITTGAIGYRTGRYEAGKVKSVKVTNKKAEVLYQSDFTKEQDEFVNDETVLPVKDGALEIGNSFFTVYTKKVASDEWTNYTVEQNMSINGASALGMLMRMDDGNNGYMIQVRSSDNTIVFHKVNSGGVNSTSFATLKLSEKDITLPVDSEPFKLTLQAEESNINIKVNGMEAGNVDISEQGNILKGSFGYRTGRTESGYIEDVQVTDTSNNILYSSDFVENDNFFSDLTVENGKLVIGNSVFVVNKDPDNNEKLKEISRYSFFRSPKLEINKEEAEKVLISVSSRGTAKDRGQIFDLFFNGKDLGAGSARELSGVGKFSGTSNYTQVYYNTYDVTELVEDSGKNVISAIGNCRDDNRSILVQMTMFKKDGTKEILTNSGMADSGWKTLDGTNAYGDDGSGIATGYVTLLHDNVNMNYYPASWKEASFDDSKWQNARVTAKVADTSSGTEGRVITPFSSENALRFVTNEPSKKVYENSFGNIIVDLGKEVIGGLKVDISTESKETVTVYMGEEMNADGHVKWQMSSVPKYKDTWNLVSGENVFETVTMRNIRFIELEGFSAQTKAYILENPDSVMGWAIQQTFDEEESEYKATDGSDEATLMNRIYELCKYTIKATNQDLFTDSQARERAAYEGDLLVNSNTSYAVSGNYSLARHSNEWLIDNPTWPNDYSLFSVEMAYWDYIYTGNTDSIRESYEALKKKLTVKAENIDSKTGLVRAGGGQAGNAALIDWPTSERDGYQASYYDVIFNAEYIGIYNYMAIICDALGNSADAENYRQKAETLKATLIEYAYDVENGCFYDSLSQDLVPTKHSSTHATAYALTYGVFTNQQMADEMCEFVYNKCKDEFKGSVYVTYFILKGLFVGNHGDLAEKLIVNPKVGTNVKTFASLLDDLNCTITPEAWGHAHKGNMTLSHPWGASPGCSLVQGTFGIMPTSGGFDTFTIKLQPGDISSANIKTPTMKGEVSASYTNGNEEGIKNLKMEAVVTIPVNSKGTVYMPVKSGKYGYLDVDGKKTEATFDGHYLSVELGSGTYTLSVNPDDSGYIQEIEVDLSTKTKINAGSTEDIKVAVTDQFGEDVSEDFTIDLRSDNECVFIVEDGKVKAKGVGKANLIAHAKNGDIESEKSIEIEVFTTMTGISTNAEKESIEVESETSLVTKALFTDETGIIIENEDMNYSTDSEVITIEAGVVKGVSEGTATIIAETSSYLENLNEKTDLTKLATDNVYEFDKENDPFGKALSDGKIHGTTGQRSMRTDLAGNVVSGTFTIETNAANIVFNAKSENERYFWQFRSDGTLKKHKASATHFDTVDISPNEGENSFLIVTSNNQIFTWLNEKLIDVCAIEEGMPLEGGIGIRNGGSESFYLSELSLDTNLRYTALCDIEVIKPVEKDKEILSAEPFDVITVEQGTVLEDIDLPEIISVILDNDEEITLEIAWSGDYDGNICADYVLNGEILLTDGVKNTNNVVPTITIKVEEKIKQSDKTLLANLYNTNKDNIQSEYISEGWSEFAEAIATAKIVLDKENPEQEEINNAFTNLLEALNNLTAKSEKGELQKQYDAYMMIVETDYTEESWKAFKEALEQSEQVLGNEDAKQREVTESIINLYKSYAQLEVKKPEEPTKGDKTELKAVFDSNGTKKKGNHTEDGWSVYQSACEEAKKVLYDSNATQESVDKALENLNNAVNGLKYNKMQYQDVNVTDWFYENVEFVHNNLIMTGLSDINFGANDTLSRAQLALILYRMEEEPRVVNKSRFPDVENGIWYSDAVIWASNVGIVTGYIDSGIFKPAGNISRQELAVMLYRYTQYKGYDTSVTTNLNKFKDSNKIAPFAAQAMNWAVANNIITGKDNGTRLDATGTASRAECAAMIQRMLSL